MEAVQLTEASVLAVVVPDISEVVDSLPRRRADIVYKRSLISAFLIDCSIPVKTGLVGLEHPCRMLRMQNPKHRDIRFREALGAKVRDKCVVSRRVLINPDIIRIQPAVYLLSLIGERTLVITVLALIYGHERARDKLHVRSVLIRNHCIVGSGALADIGYRSIVRVALLRRSVLLIRKIIALKLNEVLISVTDNRLAVFIKLNLIIGALSGIGFLPENKDLRSVREERKDLCAICRSIIADVDTFVGRLRVAYDALLHGSVDFLFSGCRRRLCDGTDRR